MKKDYSKDIALRCIVCGSDSHFEFNEDKTYVKCTLCNREYTGGYDELVELNQCLIKDELDATTDDMIKDIRKELTDSLKKVFKGNKYITIK